MVLATGYYLGVTLRIFSRTNTKLYPYTEHNETQPIIFNIFLDDRSKNSEHFQSLKQPERTVKKIDLENKPEVKESKPTDEAIKDYSNNSQNKTESKTVKVTNTINDAKEAYKNKEPEMIVPHKEPKKSETRENLKQTKYNNYNKNQYYEKI